MGLSERISLRFVAFVAEHPGRNLDAGAASAVVGASTVWIRTALCGCAFSRGFHRFLAPGAEQ